ncbi:MAG: type II secretion system F family protein [Candidatus Micrarchaeia archaeon]
MKKKTLRKPAPAKTEEKKTVPKALPEAEAPEAGEIPLARPEMAPAPVAKREGLLARLGKRIFGTPRPRPPAKPAPSLEAAKPAVEAKPAVAPARPPAEKARPAAAEAMPTPEKPAKIPAPAKREGIAAGLRRRVFNTYKGVARFVKAGYQQRVQAWLDYAGITTEVDVWLGSRLLIAFLFGVFAFLLPWTLGVYLGVVVIATLSEYVRTLALSLALGGATFALILFLYYLHLYYIIDDRTKRVERALPDFLLMVAANMRAGMTPFTAFHVSARPEFGPLEDVIKIVAAKAMGTESLTAAFAEIPRYVRSDLLKKTVSFFEKGMRSGGHLARILESSAEEIRETQELRNELIVSTKTYTIFLIFVVVIGIPLLFAISSQFLGTFSKIQEQQRGAAFAGEVGVAFFTGALTLTPEFVTQASYILLVITAFLVSILIGVIGEGKLLYGVKYFIPIALGSVVTFIFIRNAIASVLGVIGGL